MLVLQWRQLQPGAFKGYESVHHLAVLAMLLRGDRQVQLVYPMCQCQERSTANILKRCMYPQEHHSRLAGRQYFKAMLACSQGLANATKCQLQDFARVRNTMHLALFKHLSALVGMPIISNCGEAGSQVIIC